MRLMSSPGVWRLCQSRSSASAWSAAFSRSRLPVRQATWTEAHVTEQLQPLGRCRHDEVEPGKEGQVRQRLAGEGVVDDLSDDGRARQRQQHGHEQHDDERGQRLALGSEHLGEEPGGGGGRMPSSGHGLPTLIREVCQGLSGFQSSAVLVGADDRGRRAPRPIPSQPSISAR